MRNEAVLLSAAAEGREPSTAVMTIIAILLLMTPYLIFRYTGKSVTEWLHLSYFFDWIASRFTAGKKKKEAPQKEEAPKKMTASAEKRQRSGGNAQNDYMRFISGLLNTARKMGFFVLIPGKISSQGSSTDLTAILVTGRGVYGIMSYGFDGKVRAEEKDDWELTEKGESRKIGNPAGETALEEEKMRKALGKTLPEGTVCGSMMVFTTAGVELTGHVPENAYTAEAFFEKIRSQQASSGGQFDPKELGKKISLLRVKT